MTVRANPTTQRLSPDATRRLILRGVRQQRAAIAAGDVELAEAFAQATTLLLNRHLHGDLTWTPR